MRDHVDLRLYGVMARELRMIGHPDPTAVARLAGLVTRLDTLEEVLRWGFVQRPPSEVLEVVVQDEFTHDVIVTAGPAFLAFDTT